MAPVWIIGGGLIGCGWAAAFAGAGYDVTVIDPDAGTQERLGQTWRKAQPVLQTLDNLSPQAKAPLWRSCAQEAGAPPTLVQECLPERMSLKVNALAALEPLLDRDTIIASSSSGLNPDEMAQGLGHPDRLLIAHPCNPPYLMPVVELSGGKATAADAIDRAQAIYSAMGKTVLTLKKPMPGHLVNRLQAALWREAVHLAREGVASVGDIENAVIQGLAPRWCLVGPTGVFHLAGADNGGISRCIDQLGPEIERWWASLGTPVLDDDTRVVLADGMSDFDSRPVSEIAAERDARLASLIALLDDRAEKKSKIIQTGGNQG